VKHKGVHSTVFNIISDTIQCYTKGENCLVKQYSNQWIFSWQRKVD